MFKFDLFLIFSMGYINNSYPLTKTWYYSSSKVCKELEFNGLYPHKTIYEFINTFEDGLFVLCGKMVCLFKVDKWFYPVCYCGAFLNIASGSYYCARCHVTVFSGSSKYELVIFHWKFLLLCLLDLINWSLHLVVVIDVRFKLASKISHLQHCFPCLKVWLKKLIASIIMYYLDN
jgi:hypothetical protein